MSRDVPRIGRVLDLVGLLLFLVGGAVYARSWLGLRAMDDFVREAGAAQFAAVEHADRLARVGRLGFALMAAGVMVAVVAAVVARRVAARRAASVE